MRHKVQVLLEAGHAQKCVAELAGVSLATVRRVQREVAVTDVGDPAGVRARGVGRPSKMTAFVDRITAWLAEDATLPTPGLSRRAREAGYDGRKTALYTVVAGLRPKHDVPVVRFEGLPGEFSQHDFGHVDVRS